MRKNKSVLLIEDNDSHAELIMRGFKAHNVPVNVIRLTNGEEALKYLFREGEYETFSGWIRPAFILLDLRLPRIGGLEVLSKIRSHTYWLTTPVVVLTSSDAESDIQKAYELKANSYLVKPMDFQKFSMLTKSLGDYWLQWNTVSNYDKKSERYVSNSE